MTEKFNIWNKWDPLKVCMIGNNYLPEYFDGVDNKISTPMKRICEETLEDLEYYKQVLKDFGVDIIQPKIDPNERFLQDSINLERIPRGPLQPRDHQLVLGNRACITNIDHPAIANCIKEYSNEVYDFRNVNLRGDPTPSLLTEDQYYQVWADNGDWPSYDDLIKNRKNKNFFKPHVWKELTEDFVILPDFNSANTMMIGCDLYIDGYNTDLSASREFLLKKFYLDIEKDFRINHLTVGSHTDACFHPLKPGVILSLNEIQTYENTFPGWDVCYLPDQSWNKVRGFTKLKKQVGGKWWVPGEEENNEFTHFVETWLQDWVGYVEETVFDVNVLVLDEYHVCVNNMNPTVIEFLKKHHMEPVHIPWRHRYFWDGGLHCITLDLEREGVQQNYFPNRTKPVTDAGFF